MQKQRNHLHDTIDFIQQRTDLAGNEFKYDRNQSAGHCCLARIGMRFKTLGDQFTTQLNRILAGRRVRDERQTNE